MTEDPFDRLLDAMPKIAQVVNEFRSEEVQRRAFEAFLATLGATVEDLPADPTPDPQGTNGVAAGGGSSIGDESATANGKPRRAARKSGGKKSWSPNKDINFFPDGQQPLVDFAEEKKPNNAGEQNVVISYYLTERLGMATFSIPDVLAGFKACGWKEAQDPNHSLRSLAYRKSWIDTADMSAIKLHHLGRRYVEHDLPKPSKK